MLNKGEQYEIEIEDLGSNCEGIGKVEGMAVFIPGAVPGDRVLAEIVQTKKNFAKAKLRRITKSSIVRRELPCPSGECGGCDLQPMNYEGQLTLKKKWVIGW